MLGLQLLLTLCSFGASEICLRDAAHAAQAIEIWLYCCMLLDILNMLINFIMIYNILYLKRSSIDNVQNGQQRAWQLPQSVYTSA